MLFFFIGAGGLKAVETTQSSGTFVDSRAVVIIIGICLGIGVGIFQGFKQGGKPNRG